MKYLVSIIAFLMLSAGLAGAPRAGEALEVRDAWLRAPVMDGRPAAGYFTVGNAGSEVHVLTGASSPAAERVELHTHIRDGERMMMRPVQNVQIPAGGRLTFKPHGHHLMLFGLKDVARGDRVTVTLTFADHPPVSVSAEVVGTGEGNPHVVK